MSAVQLRLSLNMQSMAYDQYEVLRVPAERIEDRSALIALLLNGISVVEARAVEAAECDFRYAENKVTRMRIVAEITKSINKSYEYLDRRFSERIIEADIAALFRQHLIAQRRSGLSLE